MDQWFLSGIFSNSFSQKGSFANFCPAEVAILDFWFHIKNVPSNEYSCTSCVQFLRRILLNHIGSYDNLCGAGGHLGFPTNTNMSTLYTIIQRIN